MSYTIVIPSRDAENLKACLFSAIVATGRKVPVIVVDDGLEYPNAEYEAFIKSHCQIIRGLKPFSFPGNANLAIAAANPADDIVLLNDDALMETPGGFDLLRLACDEQKASGGRKYACMAATTNLTGCAHQYAKHGHFGPRIVPPMPGHSAPFVGFMCVYIPRDALQVVGFLDERFGGDEAVSGRRIYGYDDNDWCRRAHGWGCEIGVCDGVYVDHGSLRSTFRGKPTQGGDTSVAKAIYLEKWRTM